LIGALFREPTFAKYNPCLTGREGGLDRDEVPMAWKKKSGASFAGGSGQVAVMGELLHRQCNAAIPHVDVGTDVFAFRDDRVEVARIQVKTARGKRYKNGKGYSARFGVPMDQLRRTDVPPLFYALAVRRDNGWGSFIVISRTKLQSLWNVGCGSENEKSGDLELHIQFRPDEKVTDAEGEEAGNKQKPKALCGKFDLTDYINAWEGLPPLKPLVSFVGDAHAGGTNAAALEGGNTGAGVDTAGVQVENIDPETPQA
jgi:hypothetical protein